VAAAPQRRVPSRTDAGRHIPAPPQWHTIQGDAPVQTPWGTPARAPARSERVKGSPWRAFVLVVLVPVLLMLGSVYVHAVAANVGADAVHLNEEKARAEAEAERLEVQVTELSSPGRIRSLAGEDLGMRDPASEDLRTYGGEGEDVTEDGTEAQKANGG
jgi:cell division protein FtsL